ncbi:MAG: efflux RND transporter periplasmic adaptor subunit [Planctomycetaceae bacterium]
MLQRHTSIPFNLLLCAVVLATGGSIFAALASLKAIPATKLPPSPVFNVTVFDVEAADLREVLIGFGTVVAEHEVEFSAQVTGEVVEVSPLFKTGIRISSTLRSGSQPADPLLIIDPELYLERLTQQENILAEVSAQQTLLQRQKENNQLLVDQATADEQAAKAEFDRATESFTRGVATKSELTGARLEYSRYQNLLLEKQNEARLFPAQESALSQQVQKLKTQIRLATIDVEHTRIRAPFSGVLSNIHVEKGQLVQSGSPLFHITNLETVEIAIPLHALDAAKLHGQLKAGQQPVVDLALNETTLPMWQGHVTRIAPRADELTRTIDVFVEVTNTPDQTPLLPGTFVQARIAGPLLKNILAIPRDAILGHSSESGRVFVVKNGQAESRTVTVARKLEGMAVLTAGLAPGEKLLLTNLDVVRDSSSVSVQAHHSLTDELAGQLTLESAGPPPEEESKASATD